MTTLRSKLLEQLKDAMRARDQLRLDAVRYLLSLIKNAEIDLKHEVSDEEFLQLVQREVKKRKEAIEQFIAGGRKETADEEQQKLEVFLQFLPKQLSPQEIEDQVKKIIIELDSSEVSQVMREAQSRLKGQADGREVARVVQSLFQK